MNFVERIAAGVVAVLMGIGAFFSPPQNLGASIPRVVALFETSLASKITSSDTSMTLVSSTDKAGTALSSYTCFILDEGSASEEFVCGTASSTSVTSMIRGIDPVDGDTEVSALKKEHRRGASVKITNYPTLGILSRILNGQETIPNAISYSSASSSFVTANAHLASKAYVDSVAVAGAPDANETTKGVSQAATQAELSAGSATGTTGALLFPQNKWFNATSSATTTVPVTKTNGKLSQTFFDLTEEWSLTGGFRSSSSTFTGSTSLGTSTLRNLSYGVVIASGTTALSSVAPSSAGNILKSDGTSWVSSSTFSIYSSSTFSFASVDGTRDATSTAISIYFPTARSALIGVAGNMVSSGATNQTGEIRFNLNASTTIVSPGLTFDTGSSNASIKFPVGGSIIYPFGAGTTTVAIRLVESGAGNTGADGWFYVMGL